MRATIYATLAAASLMAVSSVALAAASKTGTDSKGAPLAAPLGITYGSIKAALPPGVTPEQAAMAEAFGMSLNIEIYATGNGLTLYTYDAAPKLSTTSDIGALVDNPASKAILEKHFPGLSANPALAQARSLNLRAVKQFLPGLTDEKLVLLDEELGLIPPAAAAASCAGECAKTWPPYLVTGAEPVSGKWSVVAREDGAKQWALDGKPLHTYTKDEKPGDAKGNKAEGGKWMQAVRKPDAPIPMPNGIKVTETMNYDGKVMVDARGMTLYISDADTKPNMSTCGAECSRTWEPLSAPRLAVPIGDFTVADRPDGMKQWAFRGKPLYTYVGDAKPGEVQGNGVGGKWHQALMMRYYFPTDVKIQDHAKYGPMLTTVGGQTLYARDAHRFTLAGGSHDDRMAMRGKVSTGVKIGTSGCVENCLKDFTPLKAAANATAWGDWSVVKRTDGTMQWSYRGYPLYTYNTDKKPGDTVAHDMYELTDGTTGLFWRVALP